MIRSVQLSRASIHISTALVLCTCVAFLGLADLRDSFSRLSGDEPTYLRMTQSLVLDGDLAFEEADLARHSRAGPDQDDLPVILQRSGSRRTYSKPAIYPVLAAPFFSAFGRAGLLIFNLAALAASMAAAFRLLKRRDSTRSHLTLVTFLCTSTVLPYTLWLTSDLAQFAFVLGGLSVCIAQLRLRAESRYSEIPFDNWWLAVGGIALGLAAAMRLTNVPLAMAAVATAVSYRFYRQAAQILASAALAATLGFALNWVLAGEVSPYAAERATFSSSVEEDELSVQRRFEADLATVRLRPVRAGASVYSALYFFVGRHTGLLLYFPTSILLILLCGRCFDRATLVLILGTAAVVAFYLIYLPHNYFGGASCIGNRYFLPVYGALLPAATGLPRVRWLIAPWVVSLVVVVSAYLSVLQSPGLILSSQAHAYAGVFRWFPYESTSEAIEGHVERFWRRPGVARGDATYRWSWDYVRFVNPFATVKPTSFVLEAGGVPAEIQIARRNKGGAMKFLVRSESTGLVLRFKDWGKELSLPIIHGDSGASLVEVEPSIPWRVHPLWFFWELHSRFSLHAFRLSLEAPHGTPAVAEVHYLGDRGVPEDMYAHTSSSPTLDRRVPAGSRTKLPILVRNESATSWTTESVIPITVGYRLLENSSQTLIEGDRMALAGTTRPGEVLLIDLVVQWPEEPGTYYFSADLVAEGVDWFSARRGRPLVEGEIEVVSLD